MDAKRRRSRGQPPLDIAARLRNWVWYFGVKASVRDHQDCRLSDDALDQRYLPDDLTRNNRPRVFQRIRSTGSNPKLPRNDLGGRSVFDVVHDDSLPALDKVRADYESVLWEILTDRALGPDDFNTIIDVISNQEGWYRASREDQKLARAFVFDDPAFGESTDVVHVKSSMLAYLENEPSADHVALLIAIYRCALARPHLEWAIQVREALYWCIDLWRGDDADQFALPDKEQKLLFHVIDRRAIENNWELPPLRLSKTGSQRRYVRAQIDAYLDWESYTYSDPPIVQHSPVTKWLAEHREALQNALQSASRKGGDPMKIAFDQIPPPPKSEMRYCLPVRKDRPVRTNQRAAPYLEDGSLEGRAAGYQTMRDD